MKTSSVATLFALCLLASACGPQPPRAQQLRALPIDQASDYVSHEWPLPVAGPAAQPDLVTGPDGRLVLSWLEPRKVGHALRFATFNAHVDGDVHVSGPARTTAHGWSAAATIATGSDWFVNWADTPHLAATDDGALWAHWLQKSAAATYAYDVALVRSADHGASWSTPVLVNDDGKAAEHGFVSLWPASRDSVGVAWLDGRHTGGDGHAGHGGAAAAMTLRAARFDATLQRGGEMQLDAMTCDCCQTDVALTARGPLLVYRDRNQAEIRDIAATRGQGTGWTPPRPVHVDGWKMPACPVNGPAVAARGNDAVVAWYTAPGDTPMLRLARSGDAGDAFAPPVTVDRGPAVQGRVDVAIDARSVWVLWVREGEGGQSLQLARFAPDLSREWQRIEVARIQGRGRATGFPQLALSGDAAYVVWTDLVDGKPRLRGATLLRD